MWCSVCQSDVATEVGADNRRVSCSNCGHLLGGAAGAVPDQNSTATPSSARPETRAEEARQLLDRWAKGHFFDPYGPPKKTGIAPDTSVAGHAETVSAQADRRPDSNPVDSVSDIPVRPAAASSSSDFASYVEEARNLETIDERALTARSPDPEPGRSVAEASANPAELETGDSSSAGEVATEKAVAMDDKPVDDESKVADEQPDAVAAASSAELDRLTREIMDRVSKITEARTAPDTAATSRDNSSESAAADTVTDETMAVASGIAASFPEPALAEARNESQVSDQRSTQEQVSQFSEPVPSRSEVNHRMDVTHQSAVQTASSQPAPASHQEAAEAAPGGWYTTAGQILAYVGVIFLTAGTCGVIVSYFGGPSSYAPYGWLGATIGQMLLFLGIVTLISAGMEQTSQELRQTVDRRMDEMTQRLDQIGSRIMRIEEASLDGPPKPHMLTERANEKQRRQAESASSRVNSDV